MLLKLKKSVFLKRRVNNKRENNTVLFIAIAKNVLLSK